MTGANSFTRKAGLTGVLTAALAVVGLPVLLYAEQRRLAGFVHGGSVDDGRTLDFLILGALLVGGLVMFTGLAVRHRHHYLTKVAWMTGVGGIVVGLAFWSAEVAVAGIGAMGLLVLVAVVAADELPRAPVVLLLALQPFDEIEGRALSLVVMLAGLVGWTWLSSALWRERPAVPGEHLWEGNVVVGASS